jgi:hypothetical protein
MTRNQSSAAANAAENGSVFIVVLFVLLALTVIGISLTSITQTEVMIGTSERAATRVLYAADSGVRVALADTLVNQHPGPRSLRLGRVVFSSTQAMEDRVDLTPFFPIFLGTCPGCMANQDTGYKAINYVTSALAQRGWQDPARDDANALDNSALELDDVVASKTLSEMFALQPQSEPSIAPFQESTQSQIDSIRY